MECKYCRHRNDSAANYCAVCGRELKEKERKTPTKRRNLGAVFMIAAILAILGLTTLVTGKKLQPAGNAASAQTAVTSWENNILMCDRVETVIPLGGYRSSIVTDSVFGSDQLIRADIGSIVFEDTVKNAPKDCWDVSDAQDRSVLAWVIPMGNELYELHLAAKGGINGKIACKDLFCGYQNVTSIDFNGCFYTEQAEDFSRMFYGCW